MRHVRVAVSTAGLPVETRVSSFRAVDVPLAHGDSGGQSLMKYGIAVSTTPTMTRTMVLETKYGKIMRTTPHTMGTGAR